MPHPHTLRLIPLLACLLPQLALNAAEVSVAGSDLTTGNAWRTPTPSARKPLDADGDFLYGTDGYLMFHTGYSGDTHSLKPNVFASASSALPKYVSVISAGATASLGSANFGAMDDPLDPSRDIPSGVALAGGLAKGAEAALFRLTFRNAPPKGVRVGVMANNAANRNPGALRLQQDGAPSPGASLTTAVGIAGKACYFFFDLTDLRDGDSFTLFATEDTTDRNESGEVRIGGFTFDSLR